MDFDEDDDEAPMLVDINYCGMGQAFEIAGATGPNESTLPVYKAFSDFQASESDMERIVPVSILTGYLGSGKTTLLNYLLRTNHGKRIAVIENEFSEGLGIEGAIAKSGVSGESLNGFFELNNGCICCTVKDTLVSTLEQLVQHKDKFDYILIETTGVANPGPVISAFWLDDAVSSCLKLDGVICVVDMFNFDNYMMSSETEHDVKMQICYADRILLNKADLMDKSNIDRILGLVQCLNSMANISITSYSCISPELVLDIGGFNIDSIDDRISSVFSSNSSSGAIDSFCLPCDIDDISTSADVKPLSLNHSATYLGTYSLQIEGALNRQAFEHFMDSILYSSSNLNQNVHNTHNNSNSSSDSTGDSNSNSITITKGGSDMHIYRCKGVVHLSESDNDSISQADTFILQSVHDIFSITPLLPVEESSRGTNNNNSNNGGLSKGNSVDLLNKFIIIGRNLDREKLRLGILSCLKTHKASI